MFKSKTVVLLGALAISGVASADLKTGLVAYYPFSGNSSDESGNGHNGAINGAVLDEDRFGDQDRSYYFSGSGENIIVQDAPGLNFGTNALSIATWIKTNQTGIGKRIVTKRADTNSGNWYSLAISNGKAWFKIYAGGNLYSKKSVNDGKWHSLVVTRDTLTHKFSMYIDGVLNGTFPDTGLDLDTEAGTPLEIGVWSTESYDSGTYTGDIDEIRIYNRTLSSAEVKNLYYTDFPPVIKGSAPWITPKTITCQNATQNATVTIQKTKSSAWDCEKAGLPAKSGDKIKVTIEGTKY